MYEASATFGYAQNFKETQQLQVSLTMQCNDRNLEGGDGSSTLRNNFREKLFMDLYAKSN